MTRSSSARYTDGVRISVIVPTRDRPAELSTLLGALSRQSRRPDEVLVVDSSDPAATSDATTENGLAISKVRCRPGANRQRNLGARLSTGDLLFFFDDDVLPNSDYLEVMVETFARYPEYAGGMGTVDPVTRAWSLGTLLCRIFLLQHEYGDGRFGLSGMPRHPYGTPGFRDTEVLDSGKMAVRSSIFKVEGLQFDEQMTLALQDVDFSRRLSRRFRLFFNPRAKTAHRRSPRGRAGPLEHGRRYMFNYRYVFFKNFHPFAPWSLLAHWWSILGMFIIATLTGPRGMLEGYVKGFWEFHLMRQGRSRGLFDPGSLTGSQG